jgi:hypothetical protein
LAEDARPKRLRTPMIIGTSDSRMMNTTSSDRFS